jgi:hypothetical protein
MLTTSVNFHFLMSAIERPLHRVLRPLPARCRWQNVNEGLPPLGPVQATADAIIADEQTPAGNPPGKPKVREVEFSKKEVLREEVKIYRQPDHGCIEAC